MHFLTRLLPSFLVSWLLCFTCASLFHSLYVVNQLEAVGVSVKLNEQLSLIAEDWLGLLLTYGIIIAIALTLAFIITGLLVRKFHRQSMVLFTTAGIVAIATVLVAIESIMNINIIAGARGVGFYLQLLAGGIAGLVFAKLYRS